MTGQIFISYKREDSGGTAGRISDRLRDKLKDIQIFMDVEAVPYGEDFVEIFENAVRRSNVLIAVIGRDWLQIKDKLGRTIFDNPDDFVRTEIRAALNDKIKVIPVLVEDATMPRPEELPEDIKQFAYRNAIEINHTSFNKDMERLIETLDKLFASVKAKAEQAELDRKAKEEQELQLIRAEKERKKKEEAKLRQKKIEQEKRKEAQEQKNKPASTKLLQPKNVISTNAPSSQTSILKKPVVEEAREPGCVNMIVGGIIIAAIIAGIIGWISGDFTDFSNVAIGIFVILMFIVGLGRLKK